MNILVNAQPHNITAPCLSDALAELGFTGAAIATAVNGRFVPRDQRASTVLAEGDQLEVLAPMQGG